MATSDISLTSGMRSNLLSLQSTSTLINRTQERLSTGKKVNTALDNPTNYFAAQAHTARATDLETRKDGMSEAVQAVKSADAGIKAITSLIQAAQGVASAALATASTTERNSYSKTYNTLRTQITLLASDSGYRGSNFLTGDDLTVEFAPITNDATLQIKGFNATATGLSISSAGAVPDATPSITVMTAPAPSVTGIGFVSTAVAAEVNSNGLDKYRLFSPSTGAIAKATSVDTGTGEMQFAWLDAVSHDTWNPYTDFQLEYFAAGVDQTTGQPLGGGTGISWGSSAGIRSSATQLETALSTLRSESSKLSANLSVVTTRQTFTDSMINTLQTGADNLTLADTNEEGSNMLMLQTRQSLGITSLSMASQAAQAVLRLF